MKKTVILLLLISVISWAQVVKTGIDVLKKNNFDILKGKKVGLVTNPTGVDQNLKSTVDILGEADNVELVALFGPEHGVRGDIAAGEKVSDYNDDKTGVPVYSLYGKYRKPPAEFLKGLDVLVYDIQDNGARSYTFISTMGLIMEAAAEAGIEVVVLDRPNPLGGKRIEGNLVEEGFISFVSQFNIPYIYGLTCGELANLLNEEGYLKDKQKCKLTVVPMEGWNRDMLYPETGLQWVPSSPHIPHSWSTFYYSTTGIIGELYNLSIGVGYTIPFETIATEWAEPGELADEMNKLNLPGVIFRPLTYKPFYAFAKGEFLKGIQIHITDFRKVELLPIQFHFLEVNHKLYPDHDIFKDSQSRHRMFDLVNGTDQIRKMLSNNYKYEDIEEYLHKDIESFRKLSEKYYLYK